MAITGINSSNYNFGSLASMRKQAQAIQEHLMQRVLPGKRNRSAWALSEIPAPARW